MNQIGHESLAAYVQATQEVISDKQFDFVVAAGDSGRLAAQVTTEVYEFLGQDTPPQLIAPIYRYCDRNRRAPLYDNSLLAPQFNEWRGKSLGDILLTDDEICLGETFKGLMDLLVALDTIPKSCTIVAENGGFDCPESVHGMQVSFVPTKPRLPDVYNAFSYTVPVEIQAPIQAAFNDEPNLHMKQVMCTLLGFPVKEWNNGHPRFTSRLLDKAGVLVPNLVELQTDYRAWLTATVAEYSIVTSAS